VSDLGRRILAGHWLVSYCKRDKTPIISIALAARAVDVSVTKGPTELPNPGPNFFTAGIPIGVTSVPPSPERAIEAVAIATGKRVSKVPDLVPAHIPFSAQVAKWHMTLEDSVDIRGVSSGIHERTADLYYGFGDDWNSISLQRGIPATESTETFYDFVNGSRVPIIIHRKSGIPASFENVVVETP
jgi:ABC-type glycerol-3-phosphate transport system substrate-binding protein